MSVKRTLSDTPISTRMAAAATKGGPLTEADLWVTAGDLVAADTDFDESEAITPANADKLKYKCDKIKTISAKADAKPGSKVTSLLNIYPMTNGTNPTKNVVLSGVILDTMHSTKSVKFSEYLVDAGIPMATVDAIIARVAKPLGIRVTMPARDGYYWTRLRIKFDTTIMLDETISTPVSNFIDNCNKNGLTPMLNIFCTLKFKVTHDPSVPVDNIRLLPMELGIGPEEYAVRGVGSGTSPLPPVPSYGKKATKTDVVIDDAASEAAKKSAAVMKMFGSMST